VLVSARAGRTIGVMGASTDVHLTSALRQGRLVWRYERELDVVTLAYANLVIETAEDVAWFEEQCEAFWRRFHHSDQPGSRKDLVVDMNGIVVKPTAASAWNEARARLAQKYLAKTYRFGGERRTVTAVHLGQVLQRTDGTIYGSREEALAALMADRAAERRSPWS
jgi:hypothetical protein